MSYRNPTQLRLGMTGTFFNKTYRVVGRAVLGILEDGQAYYWNEFYLESAGGGPATLVFEETETGAAWRLFTMFDPQNPMSAAEAAAQKTGDIVNLEGTPLRITRVDRSQVYHVEGRAPEGIARGKVAQYFNADAGPREIVVSWTGEEVEFYSGMSTSAPMVASAFKLQGIAAWRFMTSSGRSWCNAQILLPAVLIFALVCVPVLCFMEWSRPRTAPVAKVVAAPVSPLRVGASGVLNVDAFTIISHELVEMDEMNRRWQRHEYELSCADSNDNPFDLVRDPVSNAPVWILYSRLQPDQPLSPLQAGGILSGQTVNVDGILVKITELFRATVRSSEGTSERKTGDVFYGFAGVMSSNRYLRVRWNASSITYQQGVAVPDKEVLAAFVPPTGKQAPR